MLSLPRVRPRARTRRLAAVDRDSADLRAGRVFLLRLVRQSVVVDGDAKESVTRSLFTLQVLHFPQKK